MELTDFLAAIRRYWLTWAGITLAAVALGAAAFQLTPKTYQATAQVFVAVSPAIPNSAQFVAQRVKTYPDVAVSAAVLQPVINQLGLGQPLSELQRQVTSDVPTDTSQVEVHVSGRDPAQAARIANAVATQLTTVVEKLETSAASSKPVSLTVSNPASVPTRPVSPVAVNDIGLGLLVGLFLGLAVAVVRSRRDTTLHTEKDVRRVWGDTDAEVLAPRRRRARRSALTSRPATKLARRLEFAAQDRRLSVVVLSPSPREQGAVEAFAGDVAAELSDRGLPAAVTGPDVAARAVRDDGPGAVVTVTGPLAPLNFWRSVAERYDGAVLLVPAGRVDTTEAQEMQMLLRAAGVRTIAVVLTAKRTSRRAQRKAESRPGTTGGGDRSLPSPTSTGRTPARSGR